MGSFAQAVEEAGGIVAPPEAAARLRALLDDELARGERELAQRRSGYDEPIAVAIATTPGGGLTGVAPVPAALRSDPAAAPSERAWLLVAGLVHALVIAAELGPPTGAGELDIEAGDGRGHLALTTTSPGDPELASLAFDEAVEDVDRLRARAVALPPHIADVKDARPPIGAHHPLRVAEVVARAGGRPEDHASLEEHEDTVLAVLGESAGVARPHDDPDPARRVARRILQRLDGMGKWGGYHTDFVHLARGFQGNDRALADAVGEALLGAGLLSEKQSVGQRHVFLNPRRAGEIHRFIGDGEQPATLRLPRT